MPRSHPAPAAPAPHAWLFDLLFGGTPLVTWAVAGELPDGYQRAEQFAVLPAGGGRNFMVSLAARAGTSSALTSYNALRPARRRLARRALGLGLRAGLAQRLLASKIDIGTAAGAAAADLRAALLSEHLCRIFDVGQVVVAFGGGGAYRKPVLQVFGTGGRPLGYVKIGWNDWTRAAVRREADALRACAARPMRLGVPAILDHSVWRGLDVLVTAPLPAGVRRVSDSSRLPDAGLLREISRLSEPYVGELAGSPWWLGLRDRIRAAGTGAAGTGTGGETGLWLLADRIERGHGGTVLEFGSWHGDLVPWNVARLGRRLYAWDWEGSTPDAPLGFDAVHYYFQVAFVARGCPLQESVALAARGAAPALTGLGLAAAQQRLVAMLHLLELFVRHEEARSSAADADDRFFPAVARVLEQSLETPAGRESQYSAERAGLAPAPRDAVRHRHSGRCRQPVAGARPGSEYEVVRKQLAARVGLAGMPNEEHE